MATMAIRKRWLVWLTLVASTRCGLAMEDDAVEDNLSSKSSSWEKSKKNASQIEKMFATLGPAIGIICRKHVPNSTGIFLRLSPRRRLGRQVVLQRIVLHCEYTECIRNEG
eukprot:1194979-Prorocentrum_minimum.AAC.3